jgi:hypothetical protein
MYQQKYDIVLIFFGGRRLMEIGPNILFMILEYSNLAWAGRKSLMWALYNPLSCYAPKSLLLRQKNRRRT